MRRDGMTKISRAKQEGQSPPDGPGPGAYHYSEKNYGGVSFGKDKRIREGKSEVPGPGHYDQKPMFADVPAYLLPNGPTKSRQMGI
jgi:hypothetical protein